MTGSRWSKLLLGALVAGVFVTGSLAAQQLKFASLGNFHLENGQVIEDLKLGYRTLGTLNPQKSNTILFPTWFAGTTKDQLQFVGPGKLADPSKYYVILVDALGDGVSSSPSNSTLQPRMRFPEFTIRDMVNSQHLLLTKVLGISHVHAVIGISMGGMQTFQWMVAYPRFMDEAIPIVGSPRLTSYDLLLWTAELHAIECDPKWDHGDYTTPPVAGMATVADIHAMNLTTPAYRVTHTTRAEFPKFLQDTQKMMMDQFDANNWIRQVQAMLADNVAKPYGGSMQKAAATVRARVLIIPALQDHMVNPHPAFDFAKLLHAQTFPLTSDCGHLSFGCEEKQIARAASHFLEK
jgi:homoserine O-acetyltransferase